MTKENEERYVRLNSSEPKINQLPDFYTHPVVNPRAGTVRRYDDLNRSIRQPTDCNIYFCWHTLMFLSFRVPRLASSLFTVYHYHYDILYFKRVVHNFIFWY